MLIRMLYLSRSVGPQTTTVTSSILATAQKYNAAQGITGVLCQGQGSFVQVLEGERSRVNQLYAKIMQDSRHKDLEVMLVDDIDTRRFGQWSMAHVVLPDSQSLLAGQQPVFDPYSTPGRVMLTRLDALMTSGHPIRTVVS